MKEGISKWTIQNQEKISSGRDEIRAGSPNKLKINLKVSELFYKT